MKKRILTFAVLSALSLPPATAGTVAIAGAPSCGTWVHSKEDSRGQVARVYAQAWLLGYLSGIASGMGKNFLDGIDNNSLYLWVDNYCRANPLNYLSDAGARLTIDLMKKAGL